MVMAHGLKRGVQKAAASADPATSPKAGIGSRRIFPPHFKLQVLDSYRQDADCKGNQRATARKYGIHRRQIQKWLQAETNLRSSVNSSSSSAPKSSNCATIGNTKRRSSVCVVVACSPSDVLALEARRQRDDSAAAAPTAPPLDCSMRCPAAPADISSPTQHDEQMQCDSTVETAAALLMPMDLSVRRDVAHAPTASLTRCERDADASVVLRARSCSPETPKTTPPPQPPPGAVAAPAAKPLFKPYLLTDDEKPSNDNDAMLRNNNNYELEYKYMQYPYAHGLYESLDVGYVYDESGAFQPATYLRGTMPFTPPPPPPSFVGSSQRNSYSLEFKLRAIDSYYQDVCCKGNQRAVAHKYNIHRRQVQKWLKQEDELRERKFVCAPSHS